MGCVNSTKRNEKRKAKEHSDMISKQIRGSFEFHQSCLFHLLLCGPSNSGKTAIMDQVKRIFGLENQETKATVDEAHFAYRNREFRFLDFTVDRMEWVIHNEFDKFIIFCVDVSEYDVFDKETENALHKSISLFEWTCQMTYEINIILFLNKKDLFAKKIKTTPLSICFPDYKGGNTLEEATAYIEGQFLSHGRSANPKDTNYYFKNLIYWTDATDANGMRVVVFIK